MKQNNVATQKTPLRQHFEAFRGSEISDRHWRNERRLLGITDELNWSEADLIALEGLAWLRAAKQRAKRGCDLAIDAYYLGCALRGVSSAGGTGAQIWQALKRACVKAPARCTLHRWGLRMRGWCDRALLLRLLRLVFSKPARWSLRTV